MTTTIETTRPNLDGETANEPRRMAVWLIALIVVFPIVGAWFTLSKGYSRRSRILAFAWLFIFALASGKKSSREQSTSADEYVNASGQSYSGSPSKQLTLEEYAVLARGAGTKGCDELADGMERDARYGGGPTRTANFIALGQREQRNCFGQ